MLFLQPVVVDDALSADRSAPAEVRFAERSAPAQETWSGWAGIVLAQSSLDNRSPFGANAVDRNDVAPPTPAPHNPANSVPPPATPRAASPADPGSTTRIPPPEQTQTPGQPDAGPPPASGTGATPSAAPSTTAPGTATPGTTSGAGNAAGTTTPPEPIYQPSSSTFPGAREATLPGASSGASNTR